MGCCSHALTCVYTLLLEELFPDAANEYVHCQASSEQVLDDSYLGESSPDNADDVLMELSQSAKKSPSTPFTAEKSMKRLCELDSLIENGDWEGLVTSLRLNSPTANHNALPLLLSDDSRRRIAQLETLVQNNDWQGVVNAATGTAL